jgi:hypothetical protein
MDEQAKAALSTAADTVKQLITIASAILGFEITFAKDFIAHLPRYALYLAATSWCLLLFSIGAACMVLMTLAGHLGSATAFTQATINQGNVKFCATTQISTFFLGLLFSICVGMVAMFDAKPASAPVASPSCVPDSRQNDIFNPPEPYSSVNITNNISTNCPVLRVPSTRLMIHKSPERRHSTTCP